MSMPSLLALCVTMVCIAGSVASGQVPENRSFELRVEGACGVVVEGLPGSTLDDGGGGGGIFDEFEREVRVPRRPPGITLDVVLGVDARSEIGLLGVHSWAFGIGVGGPLEVTAITHNATVSCFDVRPFEECRVWGGSGLSVSVVTGPPNGVGEQSLENAGAVSEVVMDREARSALPAEYQVVVAHLRVSGAFPAVEGEEARGRLYFATRYRAPGPSVPTEPNVFDGGRRVTASEGNPPLRLEACEITLRAVSTARFIRCDTDGDGVLRVSDVVRTLQALFRGADIPACPEAANCDGDEELTVADAVYHVQYLFAGGPPPPGPYPECDRAPGFEAELCPAGSTDCP